MQLDTDNSRQSYPTLETHQSNTYLESLSAIDGEKSENKKTILKKIKKIALSKKDADSNEEEVEKMVVVANVLQNTENQVSLHVMLIS